MRQRMLRFCGLLLAVFLLSYPMPLSAAHMRQDISANYVPNEIIVKLAPGNNISSLLAVLPLKLQVIDQLGTLPIYRLRIDDGTEPLELATLLMTNLLDA